jgi:hypothetical protein
MSKEQEFKLLSKEEIEKNRITAYKYIDMSKEQTPIDGLDILRALIDSNEKYDDYRISTETVKICLDEIERFITKEKEQREEEIKKAVIYGIEYGEDYLRYNHNQVKKIADSYYNTHIKK